MLFQAYLWARFLLLKLRQSLIDDSQFITGGLAEFSADHFGVILIVRNYLRKLLVITRRKNALGAEKSLISLAYVLDQLIRVFEAA